MKKTNKVIIMIAVLAVFLIGGMFIGSKGGASSSWTNEVLDMANAQISGAGHAKKEELMKNDLSGEMKEVLSPKIAEEQAELEKMLEAYYQMKIDGLVDTDEFRALENQIETVRTNIFNRYKVEIDTIFTK